MEAPNRNKELPQINHPHPGQSKIGIGGIPVTGQLFPPTRPQERIITSEVGDAQNLAKSQSRFAKKKKQDMNAAITTISAPTLNNSSSNPLDRIATVDLETAARNEQERQEMYLKSLVGYSLNTQDPLSFTRNSEQMMEGSRSVGNRKAVSQPVSPINTKTRLQPVFKLGSSSAASFARLSPRVGGIGSRSPTQPQEPFKRQILPPLPPLKTPRTVTSLTASNKQQPQSDLWNIISVPQKKEGVSSSMPPLGAPLQSHPSFHPSAEGTLAITRPSQPVSPGTHKRRASKSSKRPMDDDQIFTDPRAPPPIPQKCLEKNDSTRSKALGTYPGPPYKVDGTIYHSPKRATKDGSSTQTSASMPAPYSPPKTEPKLSIFPPAYSNKSSGGSPRNHTSAAPKGLFSMAPKPMGPARLLPVSQKPKTVNAFGERQEDSMDNKIFFLRDIVYNKSTSNSVKPVPERKALYTHLDLEVLGRESMLNRPRPIPRTPEAARFLKYHGGIQQRYSHRRSVSCSSIEPKKSILRNATIGSPNRLPPLPPTPQGGIIRKLSNDTKSMNFEEKMDIFYPKSPGLMISTSRTSRRRSMSLPEISGDVEIPIIPDEQRNKVQMDRSTISSVRTQSLFNLGDPSERLSMSRSTSQSDFRPIQDDAEKKPESQHSHPPETHDSRHNQGEKDPKILSQRSINSRGTPMQKQVHNGDVSINPSPIQSHTEDLDIETPRPVGIAQTDLGGEVCQMAETLVQDVVDKKSVVPLTYNASLGRGPKDSSPNGSPAIENARDHKLWHNRIGQECPSFSHRRETVRSRRGPPPTPLLLNQPTRAILVQAEPSPLESPEYALGLIEEKLRKLERSSRASSVAEDQRMTLIADLEKEMGIQENHWQKLRHTIIRDSLSTVHTSPQQVPDVPEQHFSLWSKVHESRRSKLCMEAGELSNHSGSPESTRWNSGLYDTTRRNSVSRLSNAGKRMSLLAVSHPTTAQLGTPTPPDTDESEAEEEAAIPVVYFEDTSPIESLAPSLWRVEAPSPIISKLAPSLWSPTTAAFFIPPELPSYQAQTLRPGAERILEPLSIKSSHLWTLDKKPQEPQPRGLWGPSSDPPSPDPVPARKLKPLAQKPARKSKRITALPDILESPKPLPEKRGTLGIFQFPSGEKSDTGTIRLPMFNFAVMPGTMTTGRPTVNPMYPVAISAFEVDQQQSSFFDDGDEEDLGDNFSESDSDEDNSDEVDETTLWEIANLLQPDKAATRKSFTLKEWQRSGQRTSVVASPTDSLDSPQHATVPMVPDIKALEFPKPKPPSLWQAKSHFFRIEKSQGLPQPDKKIWESYLNAVSGPTRSSKRSANPSPISNGDLWGVPRVATPPSQDPSRVKSKIAPSPKDGDNAQPCQLWSALAAPRHPQTEGLWTATSIFTRESTIASQPASGLGICLDNFRRLDRNLPSSTRPDPGCTRAPERQRAPTWLSMSAGRPSQPKQVDIPSGEFSRARDPEAEWDATLPRAINAGRPAAAAATTPARMATTTTRTENETTTDPTRTIFSLSGHLWMKPVSPPVVPRTEPLWSPLTCQTPSRQHPEESSPYSPHPRYDRKPALTPTHLAVKDFRNHQLWSLEEMESRREEGPPDWLSKMKRRDI